MREDFISGGRLFSAAFRLRRLSRVNRQKLFRAQKRQALHALRQNVRTANGFSARKKTSSLCAAADRPHRQRLFRAQRCKLVVRRGRPSAPQKTFLRAKRQALHAPRQPVRAAPFAQKGNHFPPLRMPGAEKDPFFSIRARQNAPFSAFRGGKCFTEKIKKTLAFTNVFFWMRQLPILPEGDPQVLSA